jgi:hypothetical protein
MPKSENLSKLCKEVEWSEEDQTYIGKRPDVITGIHEDDPVQLYHELCEVVEDVIHHFEKLRGDAGYSDGTLSVVQRPS